MIGVIILNYLTYNETINCVKSILKYKKNNIKIYIVDNASPNNSFEILKDYFCNFSNIYLVKNEKNEGYAVGNNLAIISAVKECQYIIISNSDVIFTKNSIDELIRPISENKANCVAPMVLKDDDSEWLSNQFVPVGKKELILGYSFLKRLDLKKTYKSVSGLDKDRKSSSYIYAPSGCCFSIDSKDFKRIGFFDENTFLGYEEAILGKKLQNNNLKVLYNPKAKIYHMHMASTKQIGGLSMVYCTQSEIYYAKRYLNSGKLFLNFLFLIRVIEYFRLIIKDNNNFKWLFKYIGNYKYIYTKGK